MKEYSAEILAEGEMLEKEADRTRDEFERVRSADVLNSRDQVLVDLRMAAARNKMEQARAAYEEFIEKHA